MTATNQARDLLEAATAESCPWCRGEAPIKPFPMSSFDPDEHEAKCGPKDEARDLMDAKAPATLAVAITLADYAAGQECEYVRQGFHPCGEAEIGGVGARHGCLHCKALAKWETLMSPANGGEEEG